MSNTALAPYIEVTYAEPHLERTRQILKAHPEVRELFGFSRSTAVYTTLITLFQIMMAALMVEQPWYIILLTSFLIGAVANHAQFVVIHEATHNLIFKSTTANILASFMANLPLCVPAAIGFRKFHLLHHRNQGELGKDADLAGPNEAKWVGRSPARKALWLFFFWFVEGIIRPSRLKHIHWVDGWFVANFAIQVAFLVAMGMVFGAEALGYLAASFMFSIGLHPLGARWIQEHYVVKQGQETYSYYGFANHLSFNVGHHNEHHDFINVPWSRLPMLTEMAPEFYRTLHAHKSYVALLFKFLFDKNLSLYSRVVREDGTCKRAILEQAKRSHSAQQSERFVERDLPQGRIEAPLNLQQNI